MSDELDLFVGVSDSNVRGAISGRLLARSDVDPIVAEKQSLDGSVSAWVLSMAVALGDAWPFLDFLLRYRELAQLRL